MRRVFVVGFLFLLTVETLGQASFKLAADAALPMTGDVEWVVRILSTPWIYGAIAGYLLAFLAWMSLLRSAPVGPAFAASHLEVVTVMAFVAPLFGETIGIEQLCGAALIVAGIICLAFSEGREAPETPETGAALLPEREGVRQSDAQGHLVG